MLYIRNVYRNIILQLARKSPKVKMMAFEVTDACNSRCTHCNIWRQKPTSDILTPQEVETMLKDDFFIELKKILLTGGECVLRNDIKELIAAIHRARPRARMTISTNALLPERVLDVLQYTIDNNIPMGIGISLDAVSEKHDLIRGVQGNFKKADYLIKEIVKLKKQHKDKIKNVIIGHTLSNLTIDTVEEVKNYAENLKVEFLTTLYEEFPYFRIEDENKNKSLENYKKADNRLLIERIKKLPPSLHYEILLDAIANKLEYKCASMRTFFLLKCNGDIAPCLGFSDKSAGNIRTASIKEIWNSAKMQEVRKKVVDKCKGCTCGWGYGGSLDYWPLPFWKLLIRLKVKIFLNKFKKNI